MTGATDDLTFEGTNEAFDPGERREIADPEHHADVTRAQARTASSEPPETGELDESADGPEPPLDRQRQTRMGGDDVSQGEERF